MQKSKINYKWRFTNNDSFNYALDQESESSFIQNILSRYKCKPSDIEIVEEGEELPSGQIIWQLRI